MAFLAAALPYIVSAVTAIGGAAAAKHQADKSSRQAREAQRKAALLGMVGEGGDIMNPEMTPTDFAGLMGMGAQSGFMGSRFRDYGIG